MNFCLCTAVLCIQLAYFYVLLFIVAISFDSLILSQAFYSCNRNIVIFNMELYNCFFFSLAYFEIFIDISNCLLLRVSVFKMLSLTNSLLFKPDIFHHLDHILIRQQTFFTFVYSLIRLIFWPLIRSYCSYSNVYFQWVLRFEVKLFLVIRIKIETFVHSFRHIRSAHFQGKCF